jgi:2-dehydropantoate 2-reductase
MKVCIVGAGSIGAVIGAKLAASGHEVSLVARGAHLAALRTNGLKVADHVNGGARVHRLPASDDPAAFGPQDLVLIGLKAHAIGAMLPKIAPLVAAQTAVMPAINGLPWWYFYRAGGRFDGITLRSLDPAQSMFAALDPEHVVGCVVHFAAEVRAPGEVHYTGGKRLLIGEPAGAVTERLERIAQALDEAGFETKRSSDIRLDVWTKLIGNLPFNPIAALTGYMMNQIVADEGVLDVIRPMMREAMTVAERVGIVVPMTPDQRIDVARGLGAAKISMLQDLELRRTLELPAIVGAVIELAEMTGVDVTTIRHVHALAVARARALGIEQ